jgi:hypothetical protein
MRDILEQWGKPQDVVADVYLGSGTTLIAAEQLSRACCAIEIEPQYCQVTLDRWEAFTGQKAVKVGDAVRPSPDTRHTGTYGQKASQSTGRRRRRQTRAHHKSA